MLIFIPAYVFLALASWSALAAPLSGFERHNRNAQKDSLSSSNLMRRQRTGMIGTEYIPPPSHDGSDPMDCGSKSKSQSTSKGDGKVVSPDTTTSVNLTPTTTMTGLGPAIARRHIRSPMRRSSKTSADIFERDDVPTNSGSGNPITIGDVINNYFQQKAGQRKRAARPRTSRDVN